MLRAALYARVSDSRSAPGYPAAASTPPTIDQRRRQDPNLQLIPLRELCAQRSWKPAAEYVDAISGAATSRPQLDAMMREIHAGRFDVLTVWKTDRLGRSLRHLLEIMEVCRLRGVQFVSLTEPLMDTTSAHGLFVFQILGAVAQYERSLDSERILAGMENARRKGKRIGRPSITAHGISLEKAQSALDHFGSMRKAAKFLGCSRAALADLLVAGRFGEET
jgi:DNA invertase Pin-like site-specific DNA recombinase